MTTGEVTIIELGDRLVGEGKLDNQLVELTRASGRDGAELLHHGDAVELRPDVGHATVLEAVEVHALDPDRLAGGGYPHELLLLRTGHDPPGGDGVAAGDDVLQVLLQVG